MDKPFRVSERTFSIVLLDESKPLGEQQVMADAWTTNEVQNQKLARWYYAERDRLNAEWRTKVCRSEDGKEESNG